MHPLVRLAQKTVESLTSERAKSFSPKGLAPR